MSSIDHPPGDARARTGRGPEGEDDDGSADERRPRLGTELARQPLDEKADDGEGAYKHDLLVVGQIAETHGECEHHEQQAAAEDPPVGLGRINVLQDQRLHLGATLARAQQAAPVARLEERGAHNAQHRDRGDGQGHQVDVAVDERDLRLREPLDAGEEVEVDERHQRAAADDGHAPERLHGGVHELAGGRIDGAAVLIDARHRFDSHRVGDRVLDHIADRREQRAHHEPRLRRHDRRHSLALADKEHHDEQAHRDEACAEIDKQALPAPDDIDQMPQRHLEHPGDPRPEANCGEEGGGEAQVILDEEGADDAGQPRDARPNVDHERRQIGQPHFAAELENVAIDPAIGGSDHFGSLFAARKAVTVIPMVRGLADVSDGMARGGRYQNLFAWLRVERSPPK